MTTEPWNDPDVLEWLEDARANLIPMIASSGVVGSIVPSKIEDVKYALELGLSIMMEKPIIAIVLDGREVPRKLALVADYTVSMTSEEMSTDAGRAKLMAVIEELAPDDEEG